MIKSAGGYDWKHMKQIKILGEPVAKGRPRVTRTHTYTPKKTKDAQKHIVNAINDVLSQEKCWPHQLSCPVYIEVYFYFSRPKRLMRKKDPEFEILKETKPDLDNLIKLVKDAINDSGWWADDKHNTTMFIQKEYVAKGEEPMTIIDLYIQQ